MAGLLLVACSGRITTVPGVGAGAGKAAGASSGATDPAAPGASSAQNPSAPGSAPGEPVLPDLPAPTTRFPRLTHAQWSNTVHDLFGLASTAAIAKDFRSDPAEQGFLFDNSALTLSVDNALWGEYQRAAADVASQVTADASALGRLLPPDTGNADTRAKSFITSFGLRVFRRPLTDAEVTDYLALYHAGAGVYAGLSDFDAGVRLLIEGFLQSPHFLYRVEASTSQVGNLIPLSAYEVATRLSYLVWNTMPDGELLRAASAGELTAVDRVAVQADRLLADPRAADVISSFHAQLLNVAHYSTISPLPASFPNAPANLGNLATQETDRFVRSVAMLGGGLKELLTSNHSFADKGIAGVYGLTGSFSSALTDATLDVSQRKGILTQVGFLASNATTTTPDPIHRGVFIARRILCMHIAAPPGTVPPLPPPGNRTNRETVEAHTQQPGSVCISCHGSTINPLGFPFESYDAIGAYRTQDAGKPVNTATDPTIDGTQIHVNGALELVDAIAASTAANECYARHWLEFAHGRLSVDADSAVIKRLGADSVKGKLSVKGMLAGMVKTQSFVARSTEELP